MKKYLILFVLLTSLFMSCSDEKSTVFQSVQTGEEILFGAALPTDVASRTIYGDEVATEGNTKSFPVYWKSGDEIAVFSPEAGNPPHKWAKYKVYVENDQSNSAQAIERLGDCGLQWGNLQTSHRFFGLYPARLVPEQTQNWLDNSFKATMPLKQTPIGIKYTNGKYTVLPDMNNALMYASSSVNPLEIGENSVVQLPFKPLATAVDIIVNGPSDVDDIFITGITVKSANDKNIAGTFNVTITDDGGVACTANGKGQGQTEYAGSSIYIPLNTFSEADQHKKADGVFPNGILLKKGETLNVKAFLIPDKEVLETANLKIIVSLLNGHKTKTLPPDAKVMPNKVVRVNLPNLNTNNASTSWISELDPNIYVSELSLPGSKMSVLTPGNVEHEGGSLIVYQNSTIQEQLEAGVRAFILQTQLQELEGMKFDLRVSCNGKDVGYLKDVVKTIAAYVKNQGPALDKKEYAFVMVTYANTGKSISGNTLKEQWKEGWFSEWIYQDKIWTETYLKEVREMSQQPDIYSLYPDEITSNTTISQVANKVILKLNYNNDRMAATWGNQIIPSLMTKWETPYVKNGVKMQWGNPNNTVKLKWLYQEVTTVEYPNKKHSYYEATCNEKKQFIEAIFKESVTAYANGAHDIWFMNDLGGAYCEGKSFSDIRKSSSKELTKDMNALALDLLSKRTQDASLGLVYMNFADRTSKEAKAYKSDILIQSIIDNNFKFALRKASGKAHVSRTKASQVTQDNLNAWDND